MMPAPKFPQYKTVPTASLIPYARNARTHSPAHDDHAALEAELGAAQSSGTRCQRPSGCCLEPEPDMERVQDILMRGW